MGVPKMDGLQGKIPLKLMIWGYHHFRKFPYDVYNVNPPLHTVWGVPLQANYNYFKGTLQSGLFLQV